MSRLSATRAIVFTAVVGLAWPGLLIAQGIDVQIDEVLAGANGDSGIQFIELKFATPADNLWGPQGGESVGRLRLVFFDATDTERGEFVFAADPLVGTPDPVNGGYSVLLSTLDFAVLSGMPFPDFVFSTPFIAGGGKVCIKGNPANANAYDVNLCLSYGNFTGDTESDTLSQPAGPPTDSAPITDAISLRRQANFDNYDTGQFNADFWAGTPDPRNSSGITGTMVVSSLEAQGNTLFMNETWDGNGRTCFTCHRPNDNFGLPPSRIALLPPNDPLFVYLTDPNLANLENDCMVQDRGMFLKDNKGLGNPHVFRGSPHLLNIAQTAPYGHSSVASNLQDFAAGAVAQHLPRTLARNSDPAVGPLDFRGPTVGELERLEAFMNSITLPADGDFDIDRMIAASVDRGADAAAIQRGRDLFTGPAKCFLCHGGPVLADTDISLGGGRQEFDTGIGNLPIVQLDPTFCLGGSPLPPEDGGARVFSVPELVGVSLTAPYFHNHAFALLRDSVNFYKSAEFAASPASLAVGGIVMTGLDVDDVTTFLEALIEPTLVDCNTNTIDDFVELAQGAQDCNFNSIIDTCELSGNDCNLNGKPDECDTIPVIMSSASDFPSGGGSFHVAAADFDGDGADDLAVPNWVAGQVNIMLSDGTGSFVSAAQLTVGSLPRTVAAGDVDGDGDVDLLVANFGDDTLSLLLNNGDPGLDGWDGFAAPVAVPMPPGTGPFSITMADLNGDNELDLAVANQFGNNVSVVLNNGDPGQDGWDGFGSASTYPAGLGPWFVTTGRIDTDGHLDLLVANWTDATVSVLLNNGAGVFGAPTDLAVGQAPESIAAVDLNGDGFGDLAVASFQADIVSVMLNDGTGSFGPRIDVGVGSYPFGAAPHSLIAVDLDADGDMDIAVANNFSNNVTVMVNDGAGDMTDIFNFASAAGPSAIATGDFDNDGKPDLATAHFAVDKVAALLNLTPPFGGDCNANGNPDECDILFGSSNDANSNAIPDECDSKGDYNGDGGVDLIDWAQWPACLTGPDKGPYAAGCILFDSEEDDDVDLQDYAEMQRILAMAGS